MLGTLWHLSLIKCKASVITQQVGWLSSFQIQNKHRMQTIWQVPHIMNLAPLGVTFHPLWCKPWGSAPTHFLQESYNVSYPNFAILLYRLLLLESHLYLSSWGMWRSDPSYGSWQDNGPYGQWLSSCKTAASGEVITEFSSEARFVPSDIRGHKLRSTHKWLGLRFSALFGFNQVAPFQASDSHSFAVSFLPCTWETWQECGFNWYYNFAVYTIPFCVLFPAR